MRSRATLIAVALALVVSVHPRALAKRPPNQESLRVLDTWLALTKGEKYTEAYALMSQRFRAAVSEAQYVETWKKRKDEFGSLLKREDLKVWWYHTEGLESALYKVKARYEKKKGTESILCVKELDDSWRVERYSFE